MILARFGFRKRHVFMLVMFGASGEGFRTLAPVTPFWERERDVQEWTIFLARTQRENKNAMLKTSRCPWYRRGGGVVDILENYQPLL
jgi:hypothetical protein